MCLAVPMKVIAVEGVSALCEARGESRRVSLLLLQHELPLPGEHLLVHLGQALRKITSEEAAATWALLDEVLAASPGSASVKIPTGA